MLDHRIIAAEEKVKILYTYREEQGDLWETYIDDVLAEKPFSCDCDSLAMTCIEYAIHLGVDKTQLGRAMVDANHTGKINHMIALFKSGDEIWFFGDTNYAPMQMDYSAYKLRMVNWLGDGRKWLTVK